MPEASSRPSVFTASSANLDLLRAYAVGLVLVDHFLLLAYPQIGGMAALGFFGVLLFFLHTALVLMLSLDRHGRQIGQNSSLVLSFYLRRLFRIYPLSIATVAIAAVSGFTVLSGPEWVSNLALTMNLTGAGLAIDPLWSLPLEVQMYLLLPLLHRFANRWPTVRSTVMLFLPAVALAVLQARWFAWGNLMQYTGCFLAGVVAYQVSWHPRYRWKFAYFPVLLLGSSFAFVAMNSLHLRPHFPLRWAFSLGLGLLLPQFAELAADSRLRRWSHIVATYSYGLYLTHTFIYHLVFRTLGEWNPAARILVLASLLIVLPYLAYHWIEKPAVAWGKRLEQRWLVRQRPEDAAANQPAAYDNAKSLNAT